LAKVFPVTHAVVKFFSGFHQGELGGTFRPVTPEPSADIFERQYTMNIRKIVAAATFATGAAMALAPLASADLGSTVTSTIDSEIASQNSLYEVYAALAGDSADVTKGGTGVYDTIASSVIPHATTYGQVTPFETELYGANPIVAGIGGSGPFSEFNGAITEFDNAYNVAVFAAANGGALDTNPADYLGSQTTDLAAVGGPGATVSSAEQYFLNFGFGDLKGYDAIFAPDASTSAGIFDSTFANETVQLNNLFELDGKLTGDFGDIAPHAVPTFNVGFDTIDPSKASDAFDSLVFGAAGPSTDPGSYDVLNGALGQFFDAYNVELYSLLNGGDILPVADLIGTHTEFLTGSVSTAVTDFLQQGLGDLAGYF
jgi:hypothetical protein